MSIVLQSTGGGSVTINEPSTASNFTHTLPAATGDVMVSGNMPAFSAGQSASGTSVSAATPTKILFDSEEFDTNNNFSSSRFTPTVAGYYQINATVNFGTASSTIFAIIYKNGSVYKRGQQSGSATSSGQASLVSSIVYLNGSTDYVEIYGYSNLSNTSSNSTSETWFNGCLVRAA
jgi:hypothetical protein